MTAHYWYIEDKLSECIFNSETYLKYLGLQDLCAGFSTHLVLSRFFFFWTPSAVGMLDLFRLSATNVEISSSLCSILCLSTSSSNPLRDSCSVSWSTANVISKCTARWSSATHYCDSTWSKHPFAEGPTKILIRPCLRRGGGPFGCLRLQASTC